MAEIKIMIDEHTGQLGVAVSNDIGGNMPVIFGFLELAKHALMEQAKQNERRIQPATSLPMIGN
jgi:hypothetical protein